MVGLSHVSLNATELAVAENFYIEVLGGKKVFDFVNPSTGQHYGAFIALGNGTFIEIFRCPLESEGSPTVASYRHICFQVRSVHEAAQWLSGFGYEPQIKIGRVDNVPQFFIIGPDGVEIEFHEYGEGMPQFSYLLPHDR